MLPPFPGRKTSMAAMTSRPCRIDSNAHLTRSWRGARGDGVAGSQQKERAEGGEAKPGRQSQRPDPHPVEQHAEQEWGS
jgi:hypothetical protein